MSKQTTRRAESEVRTGRPKILAMKPQKMAVIRGKGNPQKIFDKLLPPLFGTVYSTKFFCSRPKDFEIGLMTARYPDAHRKPKNQWTIIMALPVPNRTRKLVQKDPKVKIKLEIWPYGRVIQAAHFGPYDKVGVTIKAMEEFAKDKGYRLGGPHEEVYLTRPTAKVPRTIIRHSLTKINKRK